MRGVPFKGYLLTAAVMGIIALSTGFCSMAARPWSVPTQKALESETSQNDAEQERTAAVETAAPDDDTETAPAVQVRVGFFAFAGFYEADAAGHRSGYGYELLQQIGQHANFTYEYTDNAASWGDMEDMLENGQLDLLTCVQKTPENEARFVFSDTPIGTSATMITVNAGNTEVEAGNYGTYAGKRVGVIRDNSHAEKFRRFAAEHGFSFTEVPYDNLDDLQQALHSGEIDISVTSSLRPLNAEWIVEEFDPAPFYMMMRKGDTEVISQMNHALEALDIYAPNWRTELYNKYYAPDNGEKLQLSAEERAYIRSQQDHVFTVAVNPDNAPYSYFEDGKAQGIIPEIFAEITRRAGIRCEVVPAPDTSAYEKLLETNAVDLVMDAGWDYSTAENMGYKLTGRYMSLPIAEVSEITRSGEIRTVAVPSGPILTELSRTALFHEYAMAEYPTIAATLKAVTDGRCDAAFMYAADVQQYLRTDIHSRLHATLLPEAEIDMGIGCSSASDFRLLSVLSKSAESVRSGYAAEKVLEHTTKMSSTLKPLDYMYLNPEAATVVAATFLILLVLFGVIFYQQEMNRKQRQFSAQLEKAKQEADRANAAKSSFLSSMSHDLRTPLNGIVGFTELVCREADPVQKQGYICKVRAAADLLTSLVNDTLELSRIESGKMTLELSDVNAHELWHSVVTAVQPAAELKKISLQADFGCNPGIWIRVDKLKLQKILLNLLSNAVKYTPAGGHVNLSIVPMQEAGDGILHAASGMENAAGQVPGGAAGMAGEAADAGHRMFCHIVVEDNGIGMSKGFLEKIYEPFAQEQRPEAGSVTGTGLGLTIVKRIVDLLGGSIRVQSEIGKGSIFTVDVPVQLVQNIAQPAEAAADDAPGMQGTACKTSLRREQGGTDAAFAAGTAGGLGMPGESRAVGGTDLHLQKLAGRRALLCEDNSLNTEIAILYLRSLNVEADTAENGRIGVERFQASPEGYYDMILMDIRMPEMDGYEATRTIRAMQRPDAHAVPIIGMSADAFEEDILNGKKAGMNDYITKPITPQKLAETLEKAMEKRNRQIK